MSKPAQRGARMPVTKKKQDWDTSTGDFSQHRLSDDEVIDELMQKSNGVSQLGRSDKFVPKSSL
ncbi:unnamed protein product, partial [Didymodactylos carnosus]